MKKLLLIITLLPYLGTAQTSLEKMLWEAVKTCDDAIKENNIGSIDKGEKINKKVDYKAKNGYLSVDGFWADGCDCKSTAVGLKDDKGNFTILHYDYWNCTDKFGGIYSNQKLENLMPKDFNLSVFSDQVIEDDENSYFQLVAEISKKSTNLKVKIKLLPFGTFTKSKKKLAYSSEDECITIENFSIIYDILGKLQTSDQLESMLNNEYNNLPEDLLEELNNKIKERIYTSQENFHTNLLFLHEYYKAYSQLKYTEIILGWNKKTASFSIKKKSGSPKKIPFLDFLGDADL